MNPICDIIVLTFNRLDITKQFVESFLANTILPTRLIIIDNASSDATRQYLSGLRGTDNCAIEVILNDDNVGFVRGMNQGIALSRAPFVCLSNNDLIFTRGWLGQIISVFDKDDRIGLLNPNSNNLGVHPKTKDDMDKLAVDLGSKHKQEFVEMPFCVGFCMVIKREVIDKVAGLSDEFFPMFFEDTDYSMKVKAAGYLIGAARASYVYHLEHASLKQIGSKKEQFFIASRDKYDKKWGKILRIAWIVNDCQDLALVLRQAIEVSRQGNYVWIFIRNKIDRKTAFKEAGLYEHSVVNFVNFGSIFGLLWLILKKKKRYDIIIGSSKFTKCIFSGLGYNIWEKADFSEISRIRHKKDFCAAGIKD
ncbi:MAG: glycosyltransferase family 2 protein [Candidatus Omnitrophota bacterium]|nr:glycosyltransferase family 2 protein [Candidatus Omnitrophota bacterium]